MAAVVLLLVLISLMIRGVQSAPPAIAEFAPQAQHQITQAPGEQTSKFGSGGNGEGGGGDVPTPSPNTGAGRVPAGAVLLHCIGDPPRQIEDPQSPPCVPFWTGNNGGATGHNVFPNLVIWGSNESYDAAGNGYAKALENFFNKRFEFYGRHLQIYQQSSQTGSGDAASQRAYGDSSDEQFHLFASGTGGNGAYFYAQELARRHVITVAVESTSFTSPELQQDDPYIWEYQMATDDQMRALGNWACAQLAGRPAAHAGDPVTAARTRVFGAILEHIFSSDTITLDPLKQELASCGATLAAEVEFRDTDDPTGQGDAFAPNAVLQMKSHNVTSVFCFCVHATLGTMGRSATSQGYFPEWLIDSYHYLDYDGTIDAELPKEQSAHVFGLSFNPKQLPLADNPYVWAAQEGNPAWTPVVNDVSVTTGQYLYRELLAFASGLQMAGPRLTPAAFAHGLQTAAFPNPRTDLMAGDVGFQGVHTMTDDAAIIWFSTTATGPYGDTGAFCYVDGGRRFRYGGFGGSDQAFQAPCDI